MEKVEKIVDGFRFLPPGLKAWVRTSIPEEEFKMEIDYLCSDHDICNSFGLTDAHLEITPLV